MSDRSEGPGWWLASDGQWYPPETHPSFQANTTPRPVPMAVEPKTADVPAPEPRLVGPQFPDLFQKAMEGSHLADNVVVHNLGEGDSYPFGPPSLGAVNRRPAATSATTTAATWTSTPTPSKRRWRKGH